MNDGLTISGAHEQDKEIINILIDSDLYLDLDLAERYRLLHFIEAAYFASSAK